MISCSQILFVYTNIFWCSFFNNTHNTPKTISHFLDIHGQRFQIPVEFISGRGMRSDVSELTASSNSISKSFSDVLSALFRFSYIYEEEKTNLLTLFARPEMHCIAIVYSRKTKNNYHFTGFIA